MTLVLSNILETAGFVEYKKKKNRGFPEYMRKKRVLLSMLCIIVLVMLIREQSLSNVL